jgi:hypothetical protein
LLSCDIAALHQEKKLVKQQLKAFDARFFADHGRMVRVLHAHGFLPREASTCCNPVVAHSQHAPCSQPSKAEKEPIRKLYELYHTLKAKLEAKP